MSINVNYTNAKDKEHAYQSVKEYITPATLEKWKVNADIKYDDSGRKINAKGKGFELIINFLDTQVQAELNLSLLLRPLKGKIEESLEKQIRKVV